MATKDLTLKIETRDGAGTTNSNRLRHEGKVPGILYGHGADPQPVAFEAKAFEDLVHHGAMSSLITLTLGGKKADTALIRQVQRDPLTRKVVHADLQRVSANEEVRTKLQVVTVGVALGVREAGGVLDVVNHELEIEGPANKIPDHLEVDVTELGIHEHINASAVKLPEGFKMISASDMTVVAVEPSKTEQQLEEPVTLEQAEPEVIGAKPEGETPAQDSK
ncbi:MAG: 50S ribosomal protein L25 [Candidatus Eremiobacteraeota bacterium]|nr:50S ribosomal protein L25 [Candidatus Eremiobacteraeota bacterium]